MTKTPGWMRWLAIIVIVPASAFFTQARAFNNDSQSQTAPPPGTIVGRAHTCLRSYPLSALAWGHQGRTVLEFTITDEGHVENPKIRTSSGHADLDDAALSCVVHWRYRPATQDGKPIAVGWMAAVVWDIGERPYEEPAPDCMTIYSIPQGHESKLGYTIVRYRVQANAITDIGVLESSGDPMLDANAVACVQTYRLKPNDDGARNGPYASVVWWRTDHSVAN
jgi:TonB family protein